MSTIRDPAVITNAGRQMMTAGGDITYTKAVLYGQDISHLTKDQLESLTSIGNPLMTVPVGISDKNNAGANTTVVLEATFQNTDLKADLPYTAVGFFAKRGDDAEKLVIVGVANSGAYLAAASPDGVASDALDVKVAIAIGDATNVTAVIDPAGSVTPSALNGAINKAKQELIAQIGVKANADDVYTKKQVDDAVATKADKATVDNEISKIDFTPYAKTADVNNALSTVNEAKQELIAQIGVKANADDVYTKKQVDDAVATKADKATVDNEISKIDFTPYAKTADVNNALSTINKAKQELIAQIGVKANADDVYTKKQVDDAVATKADKATVDNEISKIDFTPYAKTADVNNALSTINKAKQELIAQIGVKANADDVYTKKQVDDAVATKADKATVDNEISKIDFTPYAKTADVNNALSTVNEAKQELIAQIGVKANADDVYTKKQVDDAVATKADKATVDNEISKIDFTPYAKTADVNNALSTVNEAKQELIAQIGVKANADDVYTKKQVDDAVATKADKATVDNEISKIDFTPYAKTADVNNALSTINKAKQELIAQIGVKANADDVYTKKQVDDAVATKADKATVDNEISKIDFTPYAKTADVNNALSTINKAKQELIAQIGVKANADDVYTKKQVDDAVATKADKATVDNEISKIDFTPYAKTADVNNALSTVNEALTTSDSDITALQSTVTSQAQEIQSLKAQLNDVVNQINYIKANYIEGKRFSKADESQATAWEKENSQRIAFITDN